MIPSNVEKKKKKGTTKYDKSTVTYKVGIAQCDDGIKCEKKNKGIIKYDKSTITCDVGTAQCEDGRIKCEKKKKRESQNMRKI